jgi:UDP-N-acetylmuramoylalanine--D-glutamate ligase
MGYALEGKKVLVVGLGKTGIAAARFAARRGARVTATDRKPAEALGAEAALLATAGVSLECGGHRQASFTSSDLVVLSPGVPPLPEIDAADAAGVPVVSEVELAASCLAGTVVAVTGTNGKSTVTTLAGAMLAASGKPTWTGGNLGTPLVDAVGTAAAGPHGVAVIELSSFQLERTRTLRAHVATLLNVTEDHLDRYPSFAAYAAAKARVFLAQRSTDHVAVRSGDRVSEALARASRAAPHGYGESGEVVATADGVHDRVTGERYDRSLLGAPSEVLVENACAAILTARLAGASPEGIRRGLREFRPLPHRMETVGEVRGVRFVDDSKATNVGAAVRAIRGAGRKVVLIAGGRDKGGDYAPLRAEVARTARAVVLIGEARARLEQALSGAARLAAAADMDEAVSLALGLAEPGDAVLLAPACSSYDMFENYEARGKAFRGAVERAKGAA